MLNRLGFRSDRKITDVLNEGGFTLSAEVIPPRNGMNPEKIFSEIEALTAAGAQFLAVTKGAGGSLRSGSLPIALSIKERFSVPAIAHFTCRDLGPEDIENQLMDHHHFGIRNLLALRGDPPSDQPNWAPKSGSYPHAYQLIERIRELNVGNFLSRGTTSTSKERTDFCIGCAVYPEEPSREARVGHYIKKIEAGANYAITQMCFDDEAYGKLLEECPTIPILPGTRILTSKSQADSMSARFQVSVPKRLRDQLPEDANEPGAQELALGAFLDLSKRFQAKGAPGLHLFVLSGTEMACNLLRRLKPSPAGVAK